MIHLARLRTSTVAKIVFALTLFCFEKWGWTYGRTDGRHVQKQLTLPGVTVGRPRGSIDSCSNSNQKKTVKLHRYGSLININPSKSS